MRKGSLPLLSVAAVGALILVGLSWASYAGSLAWLWPGAAGASSLATTAATQTAKALKADIALQTQVARESARVATEEARLQALRTRLLVLETLQTTGTAVSAATARPTNTSRPAATAVSQAAATAAPSATLAPSVTASHTATARATVVATTTARPTAVSAATSVPEELPVTGGGGVANTAIGLLPVAALLVLAIPALKGMTGRRK